MLLGLLPDDRRILFPDQEHQLILSLRERSWDTLSEDRVMICAGWIVCEERVTTLFSCY